MGRKFYRGGYKPVVIEKVKRFSPPNGIWLPQFEDAFDFALNGQGHMAIEAVAGAGKTTCLVEMCYRLIERYPGIRILVLAFNSSIRKELQARMPDGVQVETCHSFNFKSVCKMWGEGKNTFDLQNPMGSVAMNLACAAIGADEDKAEDRELLCKTMSLCKTRLASTVEQVIEVMDRWGIDSSIMLKKDFAEKVLWMMEETRKRPGTSIEIGKGKKKYSKPAISFDDQVWLPIVNNWEPADKFDIVLVDEAQDLSPARTEVAIRAIKDDGRIIVCGDRKQAIYDFAGADTKAFEELVMRLNATVLPLTCSFRCAQSIVNEAKEYNPVIEASPDAPEGIVDNGAAKDMIENATNGDAIISRTNALLIKLFFKLAKQNKRVCMLGRDYGAMLVYRIKGWRKAAKKEKISFTGRVLLDKNQEWLNDQISYLEEKGYSTDRAVDESETIKALSEDLLHPLSSEESVDEILDRISNMFSDEQKDTKHDGCITLSSVHKFKGLERERVYLMIDTFKPGDTDEENNLLYVGITRAKKHLTYTSGTTKSI